MQARVSVVILARNEERRIEDALRSVHGWARQIIVLDNVSTDRTAEIARRYGAEVIRSRARKAAASTASGTPRYRT